MAKKTACDTCGYETEEPLTIQYHADVQRYCCFECAVTQMAPRCPLCTCLILGHGVYGRDEKQIYCSDHCKERSELKAVI